MPLTRSSTYVKSRDVSPLLCHLLVRRSYGSCNLTRHIGPTPRPVYGEEPKYRNRQTKKVLIAVNAMFSVDFFVAAWTSDDCHCLLWGITSFTPYTDDVEASNICPGGHARAASNSSKVPLILLSK